MKLLLLIYLFHELSFTFISVHFITENLVSQCFIQNWKAIFVLFRCSCGSVVEHCVSSAKGCGFNSQGTRILIKTNVCLCSVLKIFE